MSEATPIHYPGRHVFWLKDFRQLSQPIIILGMHRSGTTMITQMLQACGLFIGSDLRANHECRFFMHLNIEVLARADSSWDNPWRYLETRLDPDILAENTRWFDEKLTGGFRKRFLQAPRRLFARVPLHWGWKDPRTCITFPAWAKLFPNAKIVHIARHPLDVAISLQTREKKAEKAGEPRSPRVLDLDYNLRLWEAYVCECTKLRTWDSGFIEFRYEDFVFNPVESLQKLVSFCGIKASAQTIVNGAGLADRSRTRRFDDERFSKWRTKIATMALAREYNYD